MELPEPVQRATHHPTYEDWHEKLLGCGNDQLRELVSCKATSLSLREPERQE